MQLIDLISISLQSYDNLVSGDGEYGSQENLERDESGTCYALT